MTDNLPPLPETVYGLFYEAPSSDGDEGYQELVDEPAYTAAQMQAYARAALAQAQSCVPAEQTVYAFRYSSCTHEEAMCVVSLHSKHSDAVAALEAHKAERKAEWNGVYYSGDDDAETAAYRNEWAEQHPWTDERGGGAECWDTCAMQVDVGALAAAPAAPEHQEPIELTNDAMRDYIEGMEVSVDVSTGEHDAGHRYFGTVSEVMDNRDSKHGVILLVQNPEPNFKVAQAPNAQQAEPEQQEPTKRCPNCDDTGDVHSIDGEWRGVCHCPAGQAINAQVKPSTNSIVQAAVIRALDEANVRNDVLRGMCIEVALEKARDMLEGLK